MFTLEQVMHISTKIFNERKEASQEKTKEIRDRSPGADILFSAGAAWALTEVLKEIEKIVRLERKRD